MNAYFENNDNFNSNNRIMEAYFRETAIKPRATCKIGKLLFYDLAELLMILTCDKAKSIAKALSVAVCLIGFVGIIGAMEQGTLGLGAGFLIGMLLVGVEFLCLRHRQQ